MVLTVISNDDDNVISEKSFSVFVFGFLLLLSFGVLHSFDKRTKVRKKNYDNENLF